MKMYGYSEVRKLNSDDLRLLCINEKWYTRGNSDEYYALMKSVDKMENVTTDNIVEVATDIYTHSDFKDYKADGYTMSEILENIMYKIGRICTTFFNEVNMDKIDEIMTVTYNGDIYNIIDEDAINLIMYIIKYATKEDSTC